MLEFPYMQLPAGVSRPIIAVVIEGPGGRRLLDGLLDTGPPRPHPGDAGLFETGGGGAEEVVNHEGHEEHKEKWQLDLRDLCDLCGV
jgi:hypothetical protein